MAYRYHFEKSKRPFYRTSYNNIIGTSSRDIAGWNGRIRYGEDGDFIRPTFYQAVRRNSHGFIRRKEWDAYADRVDSLTFNKGPSVSLSTVSGLKYQNGTPIASNASRLFYPENDVDSLHPWGFHQADLDTVLLNKLKAKRYELGAELAEVFETAGMLYDGTRQILRIGIDAIRAFRSPSSRKRLYHWYKNKYRRDLRKENTKRPIGQKFIETGDKLADTYMYMRFGLRPLYYSCDTLIELLDALSRNPLTLSVRAKSDRFVATSTVVSNDGTHPYQLKTSSTTIFSCWQEIRRGCRYFVTNPERLARQQLGLNWSDLPATLWELVPFSWAVDYFVNVQDYLSSLNSEMYLANNGGWISSRFEMDYLYKKIETQVADPRYSSNRSVDAEIYAAHSRSSYIRQPYNAPLTPSITLNKRILSAAQIGDLASLFRQLTR